MNKLFKLLPVLLLLAACSGEQSSVSGSNTAPVTNVAKTQQTTTVIDGMLHPVMPNSPYAPVLVQCMKAGIYSSDSLCPLKTLPLIGQNHAMPTKADILAQTIVTHDWMAQRFSEFLDRMPADMYKMFRGVTAVVIGANIHPAVYQSSTGAIYLDPNYLWLSSDEYLTIKSMPDARAGYANQFNFINFFQWLDTAGTTEATARKEVITKSLAGVLFHELAHANDFMPPSRLAYFNINLTLPEQIDQNTLDGVYKADMYAKYPLNSVMLKDLGKVLYQGATPTAAQLALTAEQVALEFANDGANDMYSYDNQIEDAALLFEEVMMKYHFNIDRAVLFIDKPKTTTGECSDLMVRWGAVTRIAYPQVNKRAQMVVQKILAQQDVSQYFKNLPNPVILPTGMDMCSSLAQVYPNGGAAF